MSGAGFILAINLFVAGILGAAFLAVAVYDRARVSARWLAAGFGCGMANFALEFAIPVFPHTPLPGIGAYAAFMAALVAFNAGIANLRDVRPPWTAMFTLFAAAVALRVGIEMMDRASLMRMFLYQAPYFVMQGVGVLILWRSRPLDRFGRLLTGLIALSALHYLAKPLIARLSGGPGASASDYIGTQYALFSQATGTVLAMATALLLLVILMRDILTDMTEQSQTDKLSGLLNRRGYEEKRAMVMRQKGVNGLPVSLIICDLDHFKIINDTYGHAAGDLVIRTFSDLLGRSVGDHQFAGRIGGEEFAVLLPGSNLAAARLFAENLRTTFAMIQIDGISADTRLTASFGVAELIRGESGLELQARADAALYDAKRGGRDRVQAAEPRVLQGPPQPALRA